MLGLLACSASAAAAFVPSSASYMMTPTSYCAPYATMMAPRKSRAETRPVYNKNKVFNEDEVDPEKVAFTVRRTALVWVGIGSIVGLAAAGGKTFDREQAPGYAEAAAQRAAEKKAYLDENAARVQALKERAAENRRLGVIGAAPPKPWEKSFAQ